MVYFGLILWVPIFCILCTDKGSQISGVQNQVCSSHLFLRLLCRCDTRSSSSRAEHVSPKRAHTNTQTNSHREEHRELLINTQCSNMNRTATTLPSSSPPLANWGWSCYSSRHSRDFSSSWTKTDFGTAGLEVPVLAWGFYQDSQTSGGPSLAPELPSCSQPAWLAAHHLHVLAHNSEFTSTGESSKI